MKDRSSFYDFYGRINFFCFLRKDQKEEEESVDQSKGGIKSYILTRKENRFERDMY